ncbi:MAG: AAA family ATPase [Chitinophagaceae bacterium]
MKFKQFKIQNFKGIENVVVDLDKSPDANIYTLVGLNESGKTTILEAINFFNPSNQGLSVLDLPGAAIKDFNLLIPINSRDNFNGSVSMEVTIGLDHDDIKKINQFISENTDFSEVEPLKEIIYYRNYFYENSKFLRSDFRWTGFNGKLKSSPNDDYVKLSKYNKEYNLKLSNYCSTLIPSILYFPNFLFDFPSRIYLESKNEPTDKEQFYLDLVQDILYSLQNETNYKTHLVDRAKSADRNDRRSLDSLLKKMNRKVTDTVFDAWNRIFKRSIKDTQVIMKCDVDEEDRTFLEFEIESHDGIYQINERSLGFRWFFTFLLFTQFRPYRKELPQNVIFLFDEPASNLHSSAQKQLLKSFENLTKNSKIIYTTHSHHLINPNWLESTYVVKNEGLRLEDTESYNIKKTNITIESYREFAIRHPKNTAYFQPVLDVLDYAPSNLELIPDCVFVEGKNDYYTLEYFQTVILNLEKRINLAPSTGAGNLNTLISLYLGWGRDFIVLLDSDKEGQKQKERYIDNL